MSTPTQSNDDVQFYSSGVRASIFKADGSGFIYYPSGNVAICKGVIDGRGRFYIYSNDPKSTSIGAVNEYAVGFFIGPNRMRLALSKVGGLLTDEHGYIVKEWQYDPRARMPPPVSVLEIRLNKTITFEFRHRNDMRIKFLHDGVSHELEAGVRPKREGSYLDHSIRLPGGKLEPRLHRISLMSRQQSFGDAMKAKRDILKPRSESLAGDCKSLIAGLENGFNNLAPKVEPFPDPSWKDCAGGATRRELPRIRSTGLEVGPTCGLGKTIYEDGSPSLRRSVSWAGDDRVERDLEVGDSSGAFASATKLMKAGKWLGDLDVRRQLFAENPLLKRSKMLQAASGRYANTIEIPGGKRSASNPTGKATASGVPLRWIPISRLGPFLEAEAGPDQLITVLCVRRDDPMCNKVMTTAELANRILLERSGSDNTDGDGPRKPSAASIPSSSARYQIVKVDFGEHDRSADLYGVKSVPAFLMFQGGKLVWAGTLGGSAIKAAPPETAASRARVLLVEPVAKNQVATERVLRRFKCNWDLVLTVPQALVRIQMARTNEMAREPAADKGEGYDVLLISDAFGPAEALALGKAFYGGVQREKRESLVVGLGTMKGDASDMHNSARQVVSVGFSESGDGKRALLSPHLALIVDVAATNPLRPTALEAVFRCLEKRITSSNDKGKGRGGQTPAEDLGGRYRRYKGVTPLRLLEKMKAVRARAHAGVGMFAGRLKPGDKIFVTAQETDCRGYTLESSTLRHLLERDCRTRSESSKTFSCNRASFCLKSYGQK